MPTARRAKPLYQRGEFALYSRMGRHYEIVWTIPLENGNEALARALATSQPGALRLTVSTSSLTGVGQPARLAVNRPRAVTSS